MRRGWRNARRGLRWAAGIADEATLRAQEQWWRHVTDRRLFRLFDRERARLTARSPRGCRRCAQQCPAPGTVLVKKERGWPLA